MSRAATVSSCSLARGNSGGCLTQWVEVAQHVAGLTCEARHHQESAANAEETCERTDNEADAGDWWRFAAVQRMGRIGFRADGSWCRA
jgi:hypothetical protein